MGKVLFFDIDGTLVNSEGKVPESASLALKKARENGHQTVICSGRSKHQIEPWMFKNFDGIISSAGAGVFYKGQSIYDHYVPVEHAKKAREVLEAANGYLVGQTDERTILSKEGYDYIIDWSIQRGKNKERIQNTFGCAILTDTLEECDKIKKFFYHRSSKSVDELALELGDIFDIESSSFIKDATDIGEIVCKGINKAYGMQIYLDHQGLKREDTVAFGDGPNDLDMLSFANIGVAMGNGREEVKAVADFVTKDMDDDGIYYAMKELGLI